jgi:hypothetical protein
MGKIIYLCWKTFIKGGYWLYFGISLLIGAPFIQCFSMVFDLPYKTGNFNYKPIIVLLPIWFFLVQMSELLNMKINKRVYDIWNIIWGLLGFSIALFLMR